MYRFLLSLTCLSVLSASFANAENLGPLGFGLFDWTQELESDRPDFTEGTQAVQTGHLQFEVGYTFGSDRTNGENVELHTAPELLIRVGLIDRTEFRLGWEGFNVEDSNSQPTSHGASDINLGFKRELIKQFSWSASIIGGLTMPIGSQEFSSSVVEPEVKFLVARNLGDALSIAGNLNVSYLAGEPSRYSEIGSSLSLAAELNSKLGAYLEYFGTYPTEDVAQSSEHYINGGLTYALSSNVQIDARVGCGLNSAAQDIFTGMGLVFRI